jgi:hypothetical protein
MRSSDFREFFPKAYIFPPTTVADPGIATQKTARSSSQSDDEMQSGSAQVRSTPGTASNASERESQDVEYSETDTVIDVGNTGEFNMARLNKQILINNRLCNL